MAATSTILKASVGRGECLVKFSESGYEVIKDNRDIRVGYLHICTESSEQITDMCRDQIIKYMYNTPRKMPGIGTTVISKYFGGLTKAEAEAIGNGGKKVYYNF